jgi:hypothetical protein
VTDYDQPPEQYQVGLTMEVVQPWFSSDRTATIEVTLTNQADESRELGPIVDGPDFPAGNTKGIVLFDKASLSDGYVLDCINTDGKSDERQGFAGSQTSPYEIKAGGSVTRQIGMLDDSDVRGCLPAGIYPFEITHINRPIGEAEDGGPKEGDPYQWNFSLGIRGDDG